MIQGFNLIGLKGSRVQFNRVQGFNSTVIQSTVEWALAAGTPCRSPRPTRGRRASGTGSSPGRGPPPHTSPAFSLNGFLGTLVPGSAQRNLFVPERLSLVAVAYGNRFCPCDHPSHRTLMPRRHSKLKLSCPILLKKRAAWPIELVVPFSPEGALFLKPLESSPLKTLP